MKMMKLIWDIENWHWKSKFVDFWPSLHKSQQHYCWFHFLGKSLHLVCCVLQKWSHAKRQHRVVCQCSVSTVTPFLRIGARHRAFFSSLDLWRLVQETILYFTVFYCAVLSTCNELYLSDFRLQNQWTLKFVTIATLCYRLT